MNASSRLSAVHLDRDEGFDATERIELSERDEIGQKRLKEELAPV